MGFDTQKLWEAVELVDSWQIDFYTEEREEAIKILLALAQAYLDGKLIEPEKEPNGYDDNGNPIVYGLR